MPNEPIITGQFLPESESAAQVLSPRQAVILSVMAFLLLYGWFYSPCTAFIYFNFLAMLFYLLFMLYKVSLIISSGARTSGLQISQEQIDSLPDLHLPVYTVLVPLYRETEVLDQLVGAISSMDYPADKMDVKLLLEAADKETVEACGRMDLPSCFHVVIVPPGRPQTKPRACNMGLSLAKGLYTVIFDAEDIPEKDQLKKSVAGFKSLPENVICLQAKLNFYNQRQNLLTRWFTLEYSTWFDLYLPALCSIDAPIPLGGTSNHFKTDKLRQLGGWDAFNVTEDCDLGIRLYRHGYRTMMLDSTTWEEGCGNLHYWLLQRSRWVKGYMQTYLVHLKHPVLLFKQVSCKKAYHFHMIIGGMFFALLINPFYWLLLLLWVLTRWQLMSVFFPPHVFIMGLVCLFAGNFAFVYMGAVGAAYRGYYDLVKYAFLSPLYWVVMSLGAWKGFVQLIARPFHWEKTKHGFFSKGTKKIED